MLNQHVESVLHPEYTISGEWGRFTPRPALFHGREVRKYSLRAKCFCKRIETQFRNLPNELKNPQKHVHLTARFAGRVSPVQSARGVCPSMAFRRCCSVGLCSSRQEAHQSCAIVALAGGLVQGGRAPIASQVADAAPNIAAHAATASAADNKVFCSDRRDSRRQMPQHLRSSATLSLRESKSGFIVSLSIFRSMSTLRWPRHV